MKKNTPFTPSDKINGCQSEEKRWGVTPQKHPLFTPLNTPSAPPPDHRTRRSICHPHRLLKGLNIPNCASPRMVNRFSIFTPMCCYRNCRIKESSPELGTILSFPLPCDRTYSTFGRWMHQGR